MLPGSCLAWPLLFLPCNDCRVSALKNSEGLESKPSYCKYNPYTGEGSL